MRQHLEQACKNKIKECEEKINPAPKPAPPAEITRLTIDRKSLEFGCETKTAESIKNRKSSRTMDCNIRCRLVSSDSR